MKVQVSIFLLISVVVLTQALPPFKVAVKNSADSLATIPEKSLSAVETEVIGDTNNNRTKKSTVICVQVDDCCDCCNQTTTFTPPPEDNVDEPTLTTPKPQFCVKGPFYVEVPLHECLNSTLPPIPPPFPTGEPGTTNSTPKPTSSGEPGTTNTAKPTSPGEPVTPNSTPKPTSSGEPGTTNTAKPTSPGEPVTPNSTPKPTSSGEPGTTNTAKPTSPGEPVTPNSTPKPTSSGEPGTTNTAKPTSPGSPETAKPPSTECSPPTPVTVKPPSAECSSPVPVTVKPPSPGCPPEQPGSDTSSSTGCPCCDKCDPKNLGPCPICNSNKSRSASDNVPGNWITNPNDPPLVYKYEVGANGELPVELDNVLIVRPGGQGNIANSADNARSDSLNSLINRYQKTPNNGIQILRGQQEIATNGLNQRNIAPIPCNSHVANKQATPQQISYPKENNRFGRLWVKRSVITDSPIIQASRLGGVPSVLNAENTESSNSPMMNQMKNLSHRQGKKAKRNAENKNLAKFLRKEAPENIEYSKE